VESTEDKGFKFKHEKELPDSEKPPETTGEKAPFELQKEPAEKTHSDKEPQKPEAKKDTQEEKIRTDLPEKEKDYFAKKEAPPASPLPSRSILLVFFGAALLCASLILNIFLFSNTSTLRQRLKDNTKIVKDIIAGKERVLDEKVSLKKENERLKNQLVSASTGQDILNQKTGTLETALTKSKKERVELAKKMQEYAKEVRELALTRIGYYDAYQDEKEKTAYLKRTITELQEDMETLKAETGLANEKFREKEALYTYDMALVYTQAQMFDNAIAGFEDFLELYGDDANTHYNIAYIYDTVKKDKDGAIKHYEEYLRLNPDADDLYEVKMRIASLERGAKKPRGAFEDLKVNMNELKF
jgi:tetratricopeptide (TPR) repeat protein